MMASFFILPLLSSLLAITFALNKPSNSRDPCEGLDKNSGYLNNFCCQCDPTRVPAYTYGLKKEQCTAMNLYEILYDPPGKTGDKDACCRYKNPITCNQDNKYNLDHSGKEINKVGSSRPGRDLLTQIQERKERREEERKREDLQDTVLIEAVQRLVEQENKRELEKKVEEELKQANTETEKKDITSEPEPEVNEDKREQDLALLAKLLERALMKRTVKDM